MNVLTQVCGIILLLVILYFYNSQRRVYLHTEQAYFRLWAITFIDLLLDMISIVLITYQDYFPSFLVKFECKLYIATLVWECFFAICYIWVDLYENNSSRRRFIYSYLFVTCVVTVGIMLLPIKIHYGGAGDLYTYGPSPALTYVAAFSYIASLGYMILFNRFNVNPLRKQVMRVWLSVWLLAAMVQFLNSSLLVVGYASALGVAIIYIKLENPEVNLDRETGAFNQNAFILYIKQQLKQESKFSVLGLSYELGTNDVISGDTDLSVKLEIVNFLNTFLETKVFRISENNYALYFDNEEIAKEIYQKIDERFNDGWGKSKLRRIIPQWFVVPDSEVVRESRDYLKLFDFLGSINIDNINNEVFVVDENTISDMYKEAEAEELLMNAMSEDRVEVFFQPIYSTKKKKFISAEALVRIRGEKGNIIPPCEFIDVAEKSGLIVKLGEMVFEKVCQFIKYHDPAKLGIEYLEVNLSVIQCKYDNLSEVFINIMQKYDVPAGFINLEITETGNVNEKNLLMQNMEDLLRYGNSFSLDDFGTGQSNLNYIAEMPVSIVKFDREMIQSYFSSEKAKKVMEAAITMIKGMELSIVAEGIETKEQLDIITGLGVDFIQGYYFSKPIPVDEFLRYIDMNQPSTTE